MMLRLCRIMPAGLTGAILACALVGGAAPSAMAQTIRVQSGEHADFTRLVLDIGATRDWRLERLGDTARLILDPPVDGFDISAVFDLIPRSRLAGLVASSELELVLACPCDIAASRYEQRYLVLDIRAGDAGGRAAARRDAAAQLPDMARLVLDRATAPAVGEPVNPLPSLAPSPSADPPNDGSEIDLQEAARIMSEQLARAAAAGLLQVGPGRPMTDADPLHDAAPRPGPAPSDPPLAPGDTVPGFPPDAPVRAETALDPGQPVSIFVQPPRDDLACRGEVWGLRDWSTGGPVQDGLGALRLALFDDRDQLQRDAVLALARHYIASGFGAEAAFWLGEIDDPPPTLGVLAALVDDRPGPHFPPEAALLACSDDELLWRYLDGALDPAAMTLEEAGRIQRATAVLPDGLRDQIAPRIARALHADGFVDQARNLRDMLWRADRMDAAALLRLDRDLGLAVTDAAGAQQVLADALRDPRGQATAAMAHAMQFDRDIGVPVRAPRLDAAEALLREQSIGPDTAALWHEVVLAHAALGDLDRMLGLLAADGLPDGARDDALTALFAARAAAGDTAALAILSYVHGATWQASGSQAGRARVAAMAALRAVGLNDAADILRAGQRVLTLPAGPENGGLADGSADADDSLRAAWARGDWSQLGELAAGAHRAIAARMAVGANMQPDPLARDLPRLRDRLSDSRALRDEIGALLAAPRPQPSGGLP